MIACVALLIAPVAAEMTPHTITHPHKYQLGLEITVKNILDGICIETYPTKRIEIQV